MKKALTILFACFIVTTVYSQSNFGKIQGTVTDAKTKAPVAYATIILERDGIRKGGAYTDESGKYVINALEPGDYSVTVKYLDYPDKKVTGVEVNSNSTKYLNVEMTQAADGGEKLQVVTIRAGKPLIEKDKNATTLSSKDITKLPTRSLNAIASTAAGVNQANDGAINFLGSRSDGTAYFVDGVRVVGSSSVPQAAQGQIDIIQSGVPAQYGDFTGGAISVTTKGPSRAVSRSFEMLSSSPFDPYHFNQAEFSALGPLWVKNKGGGDKEYVALGYLIAGNFNYTADPRPVFGGTYSVKPDVLKRIETDPIIPNPNGVGFVYRSNLLTREDLELNKARKNAAQYVGNLQTKLEFQPNKNTTITAFGSFNNGNTNNWNYNQSLMNFNEFSFTTSQTLRTYLKFTQRLGSTSEEDKEKEKSLFSDAFYNVRLDYQSNWSETENPDHGENLFEYGHVGRFTEYRRPVYVYQNDPAIFVDQNGDTVTRQGYFNLEGFGPERIEFDSSSYNPLRSRYTQNYFDFVDEAGGTVFSQTQVLNNQGLYNGFTPNTTYSLWTNPGLAGNSFAKRQNERIAAYAQGEAILNLENPHDLQFGMYFEQTFFSSWSIAATNLWRLMPQLANIHISELDRTTEDGITYGGVHSYDENGFFTDTISYNTRIDYDQQKAFDRNLRDKLIADGSRDVYGNLYTESTFIDINNLDPSTFSLDMFSADDLWNNGNSFVGYFGYDYLGNRTRDRFSFNDFANNEANRSLGSFAPVYNAIWLQDKFQFKDLILRLGVRVERYDANQRALSDQYSLYPTYSAGEITEGFQPQDGRGVNLLNGYSIPGTIGDDYVVYVNDVDNPTKILGYRDGATWYNSEGIELSSPDILAQSANSNRIQPFLVSSEEELIEESFQDYDPVINVLPRIWFSFPINSEAQLFANYDKLAQRPANGNIFVPFSTLYYLEANQGAVVGNGQLRPRVTTAYEFGFKQTLSQNSALSLIASYRETRDDYALVRINQAYPIQYNSFANLDFSNTKSFRAEYELRGEGRTSLRLNYTLQYADGTASNSQSAAALIAANQPNLRSLFPMDFDTRHVINAVFDYRFKGGNEYTGPIWFDKRVFENSGANFIVTSRSGQPYSAYSNPTARALFGAAQRRVLDGNPNGSRLPWQFRVDANLMKDFRIKKKNPKDQYRSPYTQIRVFLWVQNLLNNRNVRSVYGFSDLPDDDGWLSSPEGQQDAAQQISTQSYIDLYNIKVNNPFFYATPRQMRLGVKLFF
jgi:hypothetical protein